jgi:hypothetical protein
MMTGTGRAAQRRHHVPYPVEEAVAAPEVDIIVFQTSPPSNQRFGPGVRGDRLPIVREAKVERSC